MASDGANTQELSVGRMRPDDIVEVTEFLARLWNAEPDDRLRLLARFGSVLASGWVARAGDGAVVGAIVEEAEGSANVALGRWACLPGVGALLYRAAAAEWVAAGAFSHRVTMPAGSSTAVELLDLGFGHQQAYAVAAVTDVPQAGQAGIRQLGPADAAALAELVPLVSRHQSVSPVFAPRVDEFYDQLPSSIVEFLEDPATLAWGHSSDDGELDGFLIAETHGEVMEIPLAGIPADRRGRGVGSALVAAAATAARDRDVPWLSADWRTTNPESSRFWPSRAFAVVAYRWCRVVDPTPV